ncbi:MAG: hypothetical protein APF84_11710 [Gracilibacter sp. BRH_c7a]|nr:MAG: hypothetical protein APF84_11710 [Gracilibacter sp. BRH_c7a]
MNKQLYRSRNNKVIAGVCGGVAEYFEVDPTIVRIAWLLLAFPGGIGLIAYIICWIVMPEKSSSVASADFYENDHQTTEEKEKNKKIIGIALVIIGSVFLFDVFFRWFDMAVIVPLAIIAIGIFVLYNARR